MIDEDRVAELLYNDSSKNIADIKTRQWTVTQLSVAAITALAVLAQKEPVADKTDWDSPTSAFVVLMFLIALCHGIVFAKCGKNLSAFLNRLEDLAKCHFLLPVKGMFRDKQTFESLRADEGRISFILAICPGVTFLFGLLLIYCTHSVSKG